MSSTFVSKAISKLEQKPKAEKERKIPTKEPKRDGEAAKVSEKCGTWLQSCR